MNELTIRTNDLPVFANKQLNAATKKIVNIGTKIKKNLYCYSYNHFEIALILAKVSENECFKDDGFKSAADYAMKTFGFKKTAAYSLLTIGKEYTAPTLESNLPHDPNEDFTTTQIEKMLQLKDRAVVVELVESGEITPEMSCKEIEAVVKAKIKKDKPADETPETDETAVPEEETAPVEIVLDFATACNDIRTILDNATLEDFNKYYRGFLDLLGEYNNRK